MSTRRIVLADDHVVMRQGLAELLQKREGMEIVAEANTGLEAVQLCQKLVPDVILLDVAMPEMNGIEVTRRLREHVPQVKVLALSMHAEKQYVSEMFSAGASGYLLKNATVDVVVTAIETVLKGNFFLAPELVDTVVEDYAEIISKAENMENHSGPLTPREREIVKLIAEGESTREIGEKLNISISTVNSHRQQILKKLDMKNAVELTRYAIRNGLTEI